MYMYHVCSKNRHSNIITIIKHIHVFHSMIHVHGCQKSFSNILSLLKITTGLSLLMAGLNMIHYQIHMYMCIIGTYSVCVHVHVCLNVCVVLWIIWDTSHTCTCIYMAEHMYLWINFSSKAIYSFNSLMLLSTLGCSNCLLLIYWFYYR